MIFSKNWGMGYSPDEEPERCATCGNKQAWDEDFKEIDGKLHCERCYESLMDELETVFDEE